MRLISVANLAAIMALTACAGSDGANHGDGVGGSGGAAGGGGGPQGGTETGGAAGAAAGGAVPATTVDHLVVTTKGGCIIDPAGDVVCWGLLDDSAPRAGTASFVQISAFYQDNYVCAVDSAGAGRCWSGLSDYDVGLSFPLAQISVGRAYACAISAVDAGVTCWLTTSTSPSPVLEPPAGTFTDISAGSSYACGLRTDRSIACWGSNAGGQLAPPTGSFVKVATSSIYSCAISDGGNLVCWGGQPPTPPTGSYIDVSMAPGAGFFACAIGNDGSAVCWGDAMTAPTVDPPAGPFREISAAAGDAGLGYACAVRVVDGTLACWGNQSAVQTPPDGLVVK